MKYKEPVSYLNGIYLSIKASEVVYSVCSLKKKSLQAMKFSLHVIIACLAKLLKKVSLYV